VVIFQSVRPTAGSYTVPLFGGAIIGSRELDVTLRSSVCQAPGGTGGGIKTTTSPPWGPPRAHADGSEHVVILPAGHLRPSVLRAVGGHLASLVRAVWPLCWGWTRPQRRWAHRFTFLDKLFTCISRLRHRRPEWG